MELLLISNSTNPGEPFLGYCKDEIGKILNKLTGDVLFVPYAGVTISWDEYTARVKQGLAVFNKTIIGLHAIENKPEAIKNAAAIIVGGGNSWQLLNELQKNKLINPIFNRVNNGTPYIGWSAGSNMACPTLMTTNDMPIIEPESFLALGLVKFQLNPHYTEATIPNHGGESREQRLQEFLKVNQKVKVIGLPEGMMIRKTGNKYFIVGEKKIKLFQYGHAPIWIEHDSDLNVFIETN